MPTSKPKKKPSGPLNELFGDPRTTKVLDFLIIQPEHQTQIEIRKGAKIPQIAVEKIVTNLLNMGIVGVGAQVYHEKTGAAENTYYVLKDSPGGRLVLELHEVIRGSHLPR